MTLSFGFSPCPNDTFMFDAIANGKIDLRGYSIDIVMADVQELNAMAFETKLHITKLSYNAFTRLTDSYQLLDSGSALGHNCGPLLVSRSGAIIDDVDQATIGIPGVDTTANLLLSYAFPKANRKVELLFSDIEQAVLDGGVDLGLLIHENRFTYKERGLHQVMDLGEYWERQTGSPIPLGGIVVQRSLPLSVKLDVQAIVRESVLYAMEHKEESLPYIRAHAQEMDPTVMYQHIDLYVNEYSRSLGDGGRAAIKALFDHVYGQSSYSMPKDYVLPLGVE